MKKLYCIKCLTYQKEILEHQNRLSKTILLASTVASQNTMLKNEIVHLRNLLGINIKDNDELEVNKKPEVN